MKRHSPQYPFVLKSSCPKALDKFPGMMGTTAVTHEAESFESPKQVLSNYFLNYINAVLVDGKRNSSYWISMYRGVFSTLSNMCERAFRENCWWLKVKKLQHLWCTLSLNKNTKGLLSSLLLNETKLTSKGMYTFIFKSNVFFNAALMLLNFFTN